jgi:hypothetical protein
MSLTNVWVQTMADGVVRADQIVGVTLHRTPSLSGKPSRWLLDVVLPGTAGSGTAEDWVTTPLHRTLAQSGTEPAQAPESLIRLLAQLDATDAAGIVTTHTTPASSTGPDPGDAGPAGPQDPVRFRFVPFASNEPGRHYDPQYL